MTKNDTKKQSVTDRPTDRRTDRRTERVVESRARDLKTEDSVTERKNGEPL